MQMSYLNLGISELRGLKDGPSHSGSIYCGESINAEKHTDVLNSIWCLKDHTLS